MMTIDGSAGEGGGQVLRTALGLSLVTGRSFRIENIRARRKKPGLLRQHLTAVRAAAAVGGADMQGACMNSDTLVFKPKDITAGKYHFSIGTAGSCILVFQAILPALIMADSPSEIVLEGGTHNPCAPSFDFFEKTFLPLLRAMGITIEARLERPGFFPAGGGVVHISVAPGERLVPLTLLECSHIRFKAEVICAELPCHIGLRELRVVQNKLNIPDKDVCHIQLKQHGPGNVVTLYARSDQLTETFTGYGMKNVRAEKVAGRTVGQVRKYLEAGAPVGPFLADQLLVPLALAGGGMYKTCRLTEHTLTNIEVIRQFLDVAVTLSSEEKNVVVKVG